jgi:hypothetical protein
METVNVALPEVCPEAVKEAVMEGLREGETEAVPLRLLETLVV